MQPGHRGASLPRRGVHGLAAAGPRPPYHAATRALRNPGPAGNKAFLEGHAIGTQNYICLPSDKGFKFVLFTPEATLFDDVEKQVATHFFSPNPFEGGKIRATWQHSKDTSAVWGGNATPSTDPNFVAQDAIPWLLLPRPESKTDRSTATRH